MIISVEPLIRPGGLNVTTNTQKPAAFEPKASPRTFPRASPPIKDVNLRCPDWLDSIPDRPPTGGQDHVFQSADQVSDARPARLSIERRDISPTPRPAASPSIGLVRSFQISAVFPHLDSQGNDSHASATEAAGVLPVLAPDENSGTNSTRRLRRTLEQVGLGQVWRRKSG